MWNSDWHILAGSINNCWVKEAWIIILWRRKAGLKRLGTCLTSLVYEGHEASKGQGWDFNSLVLKSMSFLLHHAGSLTEWSNLLHIHQGLAPLGVSTQNTYNYDDIQPPFSFHPSSDLGWSWWTSRGLGSEFSAAQPAVLSLGLGWRSELQLHPHAAEAPQWTVSWGPRSDSCPVSLLTHRWSPIKTTSHEHTLWNFQGEG